MTSEQSKVSGTYDLQIFATVEVENGRVVRVTSERGFDVDFAFRAYLSVDEVEFEVEVDGSKGHRGGSWFADDEEYEDDLPANVDEAVDALLDARWDGDTEWAFVLPDPPKSDPDVLSYDEYDVVLQGGFVDVVERDGVDPASGHGQWAAADYTLADGRVIRVLNNGQAIVIRP